MPFSAAGMRTEPPVSEPIETGTTPAATATPEPEDEPPGMRATSVLRGFFGVPKCGLMPRPEKANSLMLTRPIASMPAAASAETTAASAAAGA